MNYIFQGDDIYSDIVNAAKIRGIKIRIAQNQPDDNNPNNDTMELSKAGNVCIVLIVDI